MLGESESESQHIDLIQQIKFAWIHVVTKGVTIALGAYILNTNEDVYFSLYWVQIPLLAKQDADSNPY